MSTGNTVPIGKFAMLAELAGYAREGIALAAFLGEPLEDVRMWFATDTAPRHVHVTLAEGARKQRRLASTDLERLRAYNSIVFEDSDTLKIEVFNREDNFREEFGAQANYTAYQHRITLMVAELVERDEDFELVPMGIDQEGYPAEVHGNLDERALQIFADNNVNVEELAMTQWEDGLWHGSPCGCVELNCEVNHHDPGAECNCISQLIAFYPRD